MGYFWAAVILSRILIRRVSGEEFLTDGLKRTAVSETCILLTDASDRIIPTRDLQTKPRQSRQGAEGEDWITAEGHLSRLTILCAVIPLYQHFSNCDTCLGGEIYCGVNLVIANFTGIPTTVCVKW